MYYGDNVKETNSIASLGAGTQARAFHGGLDCTSVPPQAPIGRVTEAYETARRLAEGLHQELGALESRIGSVLRPGVPVGNNSGVEKTRSEPSSLGGGLEGLNLALHALIGHVQSLQARVDL